MPSASDNVTCPADGCNYSGLATSVASHYQAKTDGKHPGGRDKCMRLLDDGSDNASEQQSSKQAESDGTEPASSDTSSNPTFGAADPVQEPEPQTESSEQPSEQADEQPDTDDYVCLDCGGELVDFRKHERGSYAEVSNGNILVRGEWLCSDCGKWWFDE